MVVGTGQGTEVAERYLSLMKGCLTRLLFIDEEVYDVPDLSSLGLEPADAERLRGALANAGLRLVRNVGDGAGREIGLAWPPPRHAETMVGLRRLDNVQACVTDVLREGVPGDLIEAGVWRGGTTIFMRAILAAYGDTDRRVWVADSFQGVPAPDADLYPADAGLDLFSQVSELSVGVEQVKANFARYELLDDQVRFLPGWFKDTLATAPLERLAVMRLDGDLYESTMDSLAALYPKLSVGGYVIVDDYNSIKACRRAVSDYRVDHGITEEIRAVDWAGVYWQKVSALPHTP